MTRALATRLHRNEVAEAEEVNELALLVNSSIARCRDIARGLHPVEMDSNGLMVALNDLALRTDKTIACSFKCDQPISVPESDVALNLYRIAQEAVMNALKYARAKNITITLERLDQNLRLSICDDGKGIHPSSGRLLRQRAGMGLHIMHYRARTMDATLRIHRSQPHGTEIVCSIPRK
jgi:hypothetical protein